MSRSIVSRELAARNLSISSELLVRYERLGFVRLSHEEGMEGYEPAQIRRLGKILSFQRDLGINLAGVEVILRLQDQMLDLHRRLDHLAGDLRVLFEEDEDRPSDSSRPMSHG